jgi:hypothetical protein
MIFCSGVWVAFPEAEVDTHLVRHLSVGHVGFDDGTANITVEQISHVLHTQ